MNFFPHENIRKIQDKLIALASEALAKKRRLIVHAPTGLGKTAATLAPAVEYAYKRENTIFFLTSRHTQHRIVLETLQRIKERFGLELIAVSIIGKRWMCSQEGIDGLRSADFTEYCKALKEGDSCKFFLNLKTKNKLSVECEKVLDDLEKTGIIDSERIVNACRKYELCPYEVSTLLAKKAKVIVTDYLYIFNPHIRTTFFSKTGQEISKAILIIDEAHNLPNRVREFMTSTISSLAIRGAVREAKKLQDRETVGILTGIQDVLTTLTDGFGAEEEQLVSKDGFAKRISKIRDYREIIARLEEKAGGIRKEQKKSHLGGIANFLASWEGQDEGFARIISYKKYKGEFFPILSYRCLDSSLATKSIIRDSLTTLLMSGTLTPTAMFRDLLGVEDCIEAELENPFDKKNRLSMIIPKTTTKYSARTAEEFRRIAEICSEIIDIVPGNLAIFFPSYQIKKDIGAYLKYNTKTILEEHAEMTKEEKNELLEKFKGYKDHGAVLLGVAAGSFGEGIDLPGVLKCVVVVGVPLNKPDLETQKLIEYYNKKFGRGWEYGYVLPAITKCLQNAGRCIRSESDRGALIFLDRRYANPDYLKCFPKSWEMEICPEFSARIREFFGRREL